MPKIHYTFILYFVYWHNYIIPNVSNDIQTREIHFLLKGTVPFILLPVSNTLNCSRVNSTESQFQMSVPTLAANKTKLHGYSIVC